VKSPGDRPIHSPSTVLAKVPRIKFQSLRCKKSYRPINGTVASELNRTSHTTRIGKKKAGPAGQLSGAPNYRGAVRKYGASKLSFPDSRQFLRKLSAIRARLLKNFGSPELGWKSFKKKSVLRDVKLLTPPPGGGGANVSNRPCIRPISCNRLQVYSTHQTTTHLRLLSKMSDYSVSLLLGIPSIKQTRSFTNSSRFIKLTAVVLCGGESHSVIRGSFLHRTCHEEWNSGILISWDCNIVY